MTLPGPAGKAADGAAPAAGLSWAMRHTMKNRRAKRWIGWTALMLAAAAVMTIAHGYAELEQRYHKLDAVRAEWMQLRQA